MQKFPGFYVPRDVWKTCSTCNFTASMHADRSINFTKILMKYMYPRERLRKNCNLNCQCQLEGFEQSIKRSQDVPSLCPRTAARATTLRSILGYVIDRVVEYLGADKPFVQRPNDSCLSGGCLTVWNLSFWTTRNRGIYRIECCLKIIMDISGR
jgi:hypothetical protein